MKNENEFNISLENKIEELESKSYDFPKRFNRKDYLSVVIVSVACLIGVILGGFIK